MAIPDIPCRKNLDQAREKPQTSGMRRSVTQRLQTWSQKIDFFDRLGLILSTVCIVHCLGIPILILALPMIGLELSHLESWTHRVLLAFIATVALLSFLRGYRIHRQWKPIILMGLGLIIVFFATVIVGRSWGPFGEPIVAVIGSGFLIAGHLLNRKHCQSCQHG